MSTVWRLCKLPRRSATAQLCTLRRLCRSHGASRCIQGQPYLTAAHALSSARRHLHVSAAQLAHSSAFASAAGRFDRQPCRPDRQQQRRLRSGAAEQSEPATTSAAPPTGIRLAVYSKDGCHLCDNLKVCSRLSMEFLQASVHQAAAVRCPEIGATGEA